MSQVLALAGFGFLLGMRHATDADHIIAITTILARTRRFMDSAVIGALWGLGHTVTVLVVGVLIIGFNVVIPAPIGLVMEFAVALMLIVLGILNLTGVLRRITERFTPPAPMHGHPHEHLHAHQDAAVHPHAHAHLHGHGSNPALADSHTGLLTTFGWYQLLRPVVIGLIHGLAGSVAIALLVLSTIRDSGTAFVYLLIFCAGVAAGMTLLTTLIGLPFMSSRARSTRINRWLTMGSGILSLVFGLYLGYQIGFVDGLFTGTFHWTPA